MISAMMSSAARGDVVVRTNLPFVSVILYVTGEAPSKVCGNKGPGI